LPHFGQHIAWSESSAVCYANSVIGARSNREGGPSALAAALTGVTPEYGMHIEANRRPGVTIHVEARLPGTNDFGALGVVIGKWLEQFTHTHPERSGGRSSTSLRSAHAERAPAAHHGPRSKAEWGSKDAISIQQDWV
jgi:predicted aconitase